MIKSIIVDDEPLGRKGVAQLLSIHNDIEIVAECEDGISAIEKIEALKPDLIFMDIQMPEMDGFEVITNIKIEPLPLIIFVTAYDEYALKAFQKHAVDYLLKPINEDHFKKALERVRMLTIAKNKPEYLEHLQELLKNIKKRHEFIERLLVRENNKLLIVPITKIDIFEARDDYVEIIGKSEKYLVRETLAKLEQNLDPALFFRINRSTILRKSLIDNLQPISKGDYKLHLSNGLTYKLSRTYREQVLKSLKQ